MLTLLFQNTRTSRGRGFTAVFRHLGASGLFLLAILDSSPLPTFGGPDILIAILAASHADPWYEYVAATVAGSVIGAYLTFRLAHRAGSSYLQNKFGKGKVAVVLNVFEDWGTGILVASTAVPFPFPTSMFYAAAGASNYPVNRFLAVVAVCRTARYAAIAIVADLYGRHFIRVLRHPMQYWGWFLISIALVSALVATGVLVNRRLTHASALAGR
ncbi:MAG TPA: VTT domain-containing protein [Bryobacteraceae bacterium]|nr:VTT domain-containing protein [Bryobacteraceae bacterium]